VLLRQEQGEKGGVPQFETVLWQNRYMSLVPRGWDADGQGMGPAAV
jgi:hypothetical protein